MAQSLASAGESNAFSNSAARADAIRSAVQWLAEREAEVKVLNSTIRKYKTEVIRGYLGFKISDFNAVCRINQLEVADRDQLLECVREGFAALGLGGSVDWVDAAQSTPRGRNGAAPPDAAARTAGYQDGISGGHDRAGQYPQGEPGHADYMLGRADGEAERERVMALGDGAGDTAPRRGRGRPRKQQVVEADLEF